MVAFGGRASVRRRELGRRWSERATACVSSIRTRRGGRLRGRDPSRGGTRAAPAGSALSCRKRSFATHGDGLRPRLEDRRLPVADLQRDALRAAGIDDAANLYHDLASGVRDDRPGLDSCLGALRKGDVLVVWKLDRLGRNRAAA